MKSEKELPQPATVNAGGFPLGSPESRAAAAGNGKSSRAEDHIGEEPMVFKFYRER